MTDDTTNTTAGPFHGRVLVVDDEDVNRLVARGMIEVLGIDPDFAESGAQAIEKSASHHYDLILMDVQMPGIDGIEATTLIRKQEQTAGRERASIVALTANVTKGDRERCLDAGMDDFMAKPLMRDILIATFERWLGGLGDQGDQGSLDGPGPGDTASTLDSDRLAALGQAMQSVPGGLRRVLESYQESLSRLPAAIIHAGQSDDFDAMARAAHALKSNSAAAGALKLSALSADLEKAARAGDVMAIGALILGIENELGDVKLAIAAELDGTSK